MERVAYAGDQEVLALIRNSDTQAFHTLYNQYWKKLCAIAYGKTGNREEAMDLVQELFLELWKKREDLSVTSSLDSYLVSALYYKVFHYFRTKGLTEKHYQHFQTFLSQHNQNTDPLLQQEAEIGYEQLQQLINQTIEEMPEKMRRVFQMSRSGEFSVAEIALKLGISPQTVKNQINNALMRLREATREHARVLPFYIWFVLLMNK